MIVLRFVVALISVKESLSFPITRVASHRSKFLSKTDIITFASTSSSTSSRSVDAPISNENNCVMVALTRENGNNKKLKVALEGNEAMRMMGIDLVFHELPCIEHAGGDDQSKLVEILSSDSYKEFNYFVVTSPEAARVLYSTIEESGTVSIDSFNANVKVAVVGKATAKVLRDYGIDVAFVPSQATGELLASELPFVGDNSAPTKVLYPASAKAGNDIQEGLNARKDSDGALFSFTRLNTYDTVGATFSEQQLSTMDQIEIACFGSPSAVEAWLKNVDVKGGWESLDDEEKKTLGPDGNGNVIAACIGTTSARACLESGRWHANDIYYPKENPGVESWAATTSQAAGDVMERKFWS